MGSDAGKDWHTYLVQLQGHIAVGRHVARHKSGYLFLVGRTEEESLLFAVSQAEELGTRAWSAESS